MTALSLTETLSRQWGVLSRAQALEHLTPFEVRRQLRTEWCRLLPGVYGAFRGAPTEEQRRRAAQLYVGETGRLTDVWALSLAGVRFLPADTVVRMLCDWNTRRKSTGFVSVTRTRYLPERLDDNMVALAPVERALVDFGSRETDERTVRAVFCDAVQRRLAALSDVDKVAAHGPLLGRRLIGALRDELHDGIRSAPEADFRDIALSARGVPRPLFNPLIRLPDGRRISPDALLEDAPLIHETNGRLAHEEHDLFESMQERHDVLTAAGFTVLHNPPRRLLTARAIVQREWEQCYGRLSPTGLPPGIVLERRGPE